MFILTGLTEYRPPEILKVKEKSYRIFKKDSVRHLNTVLLFVLYPLSLKASLKSLFGQPGIFMNEAILPGDLSNVRMYFAGARQLLQRDPFSNCLCEHLSQPPVHDFFESRVQRLGRQEFPSYNCAPVISPE